MKTVKGLLSVVAIAALVGPAAMVLPSAAAVTNHEVAVTCDEDVEIGGVPGDTYTFTFTGFCLDPQGNSVPAGGRWVDHLNIQNAQAAGTDDCRSDFTAPGFLSKPTAIVVDESTSAESDQTATLSSYYCFAPLSVDPQIPFALPEGTPADRMDWFFYTNQELPAGIEFVRASGISLLGANALGTALANGTVVGTISNNLTANTWQIIYKGAGAVTPPAAEPTITIAKSRDGNVVTIKGATTGMRAGTKVTPHFKTSVDGEFVAGKKITVAAKGKFTWNKNVKKKTTLWVYFTGKGVTSNTVQVKP